MPFNACDIVIKCISLIVKVTIRFGELHRTENKGFLLFIFGKQTKQS